MSPLYRWFCGLEQFAVIQVPGKSTLQDYAHWLPAEKMERVLETLTRAVADEERAREIGLESELDMAMAWVDTTCLKACIHFPIDWVLMRDAVRTLVKCILTYPPARTQTADCRARRISCARSMRCRWA